MTEIKHVSAYSGQEIEEAANSWPSIGRYLKLLQQPALTAHDKIRKKRHGLWLRAALATFELKNATEQINGSEPNLASANSLPATHSIQSFSSAREICAFWSNAADQLIHEAWHLSGLSEQNLCLLALGKLGAGELNLSSDVDLIVVRADQQDPDLKSLRFFQSLLADLTSYGYALRVDFNLRPGGSASPAIPSLSEFENYYGYQGEMWERLAYVRMRILESPKRSEGVTSELSLDSALRIFTRKYSYRKHLDYTLLEDLKALRGKIRLEKAERRPNSYHLKLGAGGIRELELFVHALQVLHGGRNISLQTASTTNALRTISELKLLPSAECEFLESAYWQLRRFENEIQAYEDQQTYLIDMKQPSAALEIGFESELLGTTARVAEIATSLFGEIEITEELPDSIAEQQEWLKAHRFSESSCQNTWPDLLSATALSSKSERDEAARRTFLNTFVVQLAESRIDRDLGLSLLLDFVKATRAKASFFTLLNREPRVLSNLVQLFSSSPYLGSILASRPELIDEFIYQKQASVSSDMNQLLEELAERRLLAELISANHFLSDHDLAKLSSNLSENADAITNALLKQLIAEFGPSEIGLLAMGKWGGRELGLKSDLDFIFITPQEPAPADHKIAKRFLSRITESHRGGAIYSVDIRLRPSGSSGPILVSHKSLKEYLETKAVAWERQAYLRARPLCALSFSPAKICAIRKLSEIDVKELAEIRAKLFTPLARPAQTTDSTPLSAPKLDQKLDLKLSYGGLADIEFTAQIACLALGEFSLDPATTAMIQYLESRDENWKNVGPGIRECYRRLRENEQLFQLTTSQSGSSMRVASDEFRRLALLQNMTAPELQKLLCQTLGEALYALEKVRLQPA